MERKRESLPLQGIDRATPDDTVKDGACEDLYNLRYRSGAFETVCAPLVLQPVTEWDGFSVVSRLDDMPVDEYIARKDDALCHIRLSDGSVSLLGELGALPGEATGVRYFRFGRMFYVNYQQEGQLQEAVWYYRDGSFSGVSFATLAPPEVRITCEWKSAAQETIDIGGELFRAVKFARISRNTSDPTEDSEEWYYNTGVGALNDLGYITGTFYLFAAYELYDGTIIKPSVFHTVSGDDLNAEGTGATALYKVPHELKEEGGQWVPANTNVYEYWGRRCGVKPTVTVSVPSEATSLAAKGLIRRVVIFSTRNMETYDFENVHTRFGEDHTVVMMSDKSNYCRATSHDSIRSEEIDTPSGPFYRVGEIDFAEGETTLALNYADHYEHIENEEVWSPDFSNHDTRSTLKYDYNDRLHRAALQTVLFSGYNPYLTGADTPGGTLPFIRSTWSYEGTLPYVFGADWEIDTGGESRYVRWSGPLGMWHSGEKRAVILRNPIHYPDSRCKGVDLWVRDTDGGLVFHRHFKLEQDASTNSASYVFADCGEATVVDDTSYERDLPLSDNGIPVAFVSSLDSSSNDRTWYFPTPEPVLTESNKVQVSESGNPFDFDPAQTYTVGSGGEQIREIISTAERMTEAAYGYQPLLVFTDRAVYALESGEGEVLYARSIPILSRAIYEGTNAVEGNGSVFFCCSSGVISIVRGRITAISEVLRRAAGSEAVEGSEEPDFDRYIQSAHLLFNRKESELVIYNPAYSYAWLYSLSGNYWSRRDWEATVEPCFDRIVVRGGIASLSEEELSAPAAECGVVTRPLKFSSTEYKRIETLAARLRWGDRRRFVLSIDGSDDAIHWVALRSEPDLPYIRRTPSSFRYHRIRLSGSVGDFLAISRFDCEYLVKFVHRLR